HRPVRAAGRRLLHLRPVLQRRARRAADHGPAGPHRLRDPRTRGRVALGREDRVPPHARPDGADADAPGLPPGGRARVPRVRARARALRVRRDRVEGAAARRGDVVAAPERQMTLAPPRSWLDALELERLFAGALDFLPRSFDDARGLCSFKAELVDGELVQDWSNRVAPRYTITSLLGLHAAGYDGAAPLTERFLELNEITNPADKGLLAVLHCERGDLEGAAELVPQLRELAGARLEMQDLA